MVMRPRRALILIMVPALFAAGCSPRRAPSAHTAHAKKQSLVENAFRAAAAPNANGFDFPVGPPDGRGYYSAQDFGDNSHLGEDWNRRGGNDLGDPVFAVASGVVVFAADHGGGWGNVLRIVHRTAKGEYLESLYAHLNQMDVKPGDMVNKGTRIGTIGSAGGQYSPHLHLEMRRNIHLPIGGGYGNRSDMRGFFAPTPFILANRTIPAGSKPRFFSFPIAPSYQGGNARGNQVIAFTRARKLNKLRRALEAGGNVNQGDEHGRTALHYAAAMGYSSGARLLLKRGARPHARDDYGYTPLMRARFAFRTPARLRRTLRNNRSAP